MKKRFLNLCIMVVGMLALLMYGKEKESTIQDVNANSSKAAWEERVLAVMERHIRYHLRG